MMNERIKKKIRTLTQETGDVFFHTGFCQLGLLFLVVVVHETGACLGACQDPGLGADCTMAEFLNEHPVQPRGPMDPPDPLWHPVHLPDPDRKPGHPAI